MEPTKAKRIVLHCSNGYTATYTQCEILERYLCWLRFNGTNDIGNRVTVTTSLPAEIIE